MLSPTQPSHFPLYPFPSSLSPTLLQVVVAEEGMECVEGALKSSFNHHFPHHRQPLRFPNESWAVNNSLQNGAVADDLFVDQLLDFSNAPSDVSHEEHIPLENLDNNYDGATTNTAAAATTSDVLLSSNNEFVSLPDCGLGVTSDDLESLEWLSHFVEDSFSDYSLTCPVSKLPPEPTKARAGTEIRVFESKPSFATPVQTKARTKRLRSAGRVWSLGSPSLTESSSSSTSSSSTTTSSSSLGQCQTQTAESLLGGPPVKKQKKKLAVAESAGAGGGCGYGGAQQPRRCSHCGVQKTPQWRAGPHGAKTLCNACGVRYKSGRLLPEYRPVCSPTFSSELHSNNHRKVLEMRRKKELETGLTPPVQSF